MVENENKIKIIEVGKFYLIHDGSKTGHPGLVVWKDDDMNRYLGLRTRILGYSIAEMKERLR